MSKPKTPARRQAEAPPLPGSQVPTTMADVIDSLERTLACDPRDWSTNRRDAWIWGVVFGWPGEAMDEVRKDHGWTDETVTRLRRLNAAVKAEKRRAERRSRRKP